MDGDILNNFKVIEVKLVHIYNQKLKINQKNEQLHLYIRVFQTNMYVIQKIHALHRKISLYTYLYTVSELAKG